MFEEMLDSTIVDWLEELPLDELPNDYVRMIVSDFREGKLTVTEALDVLNEDCKDVLSEQVRQNIELESLLGDLEE